MNGHFMYSTTLSETNTPFLAQFGGCDLHFSVTYTLANTVIAIDVCVDLAWSTNSHPSENAGYAPVDTSNKNSLCSQPNWAFSLE